MYNTKYIPKLEESAYQKYSQCKLLHLQTDTNEKSYVMKISETNVCPICAKEIKTIKNAFPECTSVITLWSQLEL